MNSSERIPTDRADEIDVMAALSLMWRYKYLILLASLVCGIAAVVLALTATPRYKAEVAITEVRNAGMGNAGLLASQFGGLANLVGLSGAAIGDPGREAQAVLRSNRLAEEFIRRQELLARLTSSSKNPPSLWFAVKRFRETVLAIHQDKTTGITTVSIKWTDPVTAARWANGFIALANELIRAHALNDSSRNMAYLEDQIGRTNSLELQRVMYNLIESEAKTFMLAKGRAEYAFMVVDPAVAPEMRSSPRRTLMVLTGIVLGGIIGVALAFTHNAWCRYRGRTSRTQ